VEGEENFVIKQGFVFRPGTVFPKLFKFVDQKSMKTFYADHKTFKNNSADHREEKNCKKYTLTSNALVFKMVLTID
jgi:hypothetical protein